ncbi:histidine kinase [Nonomuraea sp. 3-1Str]|uniref:sensor histidine kinase n=1 Tax=Nonomuraea sp. 3-1Str TaxID=2929801 RepID=UPI0028596523|nr:histidine kinase [Nonomuraea sp. 3-1Str]MDR8410926.1 histidine kinase [Nonomuraea sp. 3-1Str]
MTYGDGSVIERITPWALGAMVFVLSMASASGALGVATGLPWPVPAAMAAASGAAAVFVAVEERSPGRVNGRGLWLLAVVGAVAQVWLVMWPAAAAASYYAGTRLRGRGLWLYCGGAVAVLFTGGVVSRLGGGYRMLVAGTPANVVLMGGALLGLPLVAGLWTRARRQVIDAMRDQADQLRREQVLRADQARAQERARIAREMHDVVAHRVSLMVLHAGALEVGAPDGRTAEAAALIGRVGREALTNLREVLGVLRSTDPPVRGPGQGSGDPVRESRSGTGDHVRDPARPSTGSAEEPRADAAGRFRAAFAGPAADQAEPADSARVRDTTSGPASGERATGGAERHPQPTLADVDRLLDQSRALGVVVNRHDEGVARPLASTVERTAYRVIQEALTNAHKHAGDTRIDVLVRYLPADLEVVVRNTAPSAPGSGPPDHGGPRGEGGPRPGQRGGGLPGSGWGLVGLRERVELAGGRLVAGPQNGAGAQDGLGPEAFQVLARIPAP